MSPPQQQAGPFLVHPGYYGHPMMAAAHQPYHPAAAGQAYGVYGPPPPHAGGWAGCVRVWLSGGTALAWGAGGLDMQQQGLWDCS